MLQAALPLVASEFAALVGPYLPRKIAVAVSGGIDSMALTFLLHQHVKLNGMQCEIHACTVDHGLRATSAAEARQVAEIIRSFASGMMLMFE